MGVAAISDFVACGDVGINDGEEGVEVDVLGVDGDDGSGVVVVADGDVALGVTGDVFTVSGVVFVLVGVIVAGGVCMAGDEEDT